jgi:RNA polymerase sigma factor (sigma-70 family)
VGDADRKIPAHHAAEVASLYRADAGWLFGHACLLLQQDRELDAVPELAMDLVHDTFVAAALAWDTVGALAPVQQRKWLRTTLEHKATDHFRRRVSLRGKQAELQRRYQAAEPDPEEQALDGLAVEKAMKIIDELAARQRRIALMKWNDHMKEAEIAAVLGCSRGTVAAEVHEIRRKLIDGLGPYYPFAGDDGEGESS